MYRRHAKRHVLSSQGHLVPFFKVVVVTAWVVVIFVVLKEVSTEIAVVVMMNILVKILVRATAAPDVLASQIL